VQKEKKPEGTGIRDMDLLDGWREDRAGRKRGKMTSLPKEEDLEKDLWAAEATSS